MRARLFRPAPFCLAAALLACGGAEERRVEHFKKAIGFFEARNLDKAAIEFKNVLQIDPKTAEPYYYLGRIEEEKKDLGQAFGFYQRAVELDPNYGEARLKLAQFLILTRNPDKAAETLAPVAKEKPADVDVRLLQAVISNLKGDSEAAFNGLKAIVDEKPAKPDPYLILAALYAQRAKPLEAEGALKAGIAANPKSPALLGSLIRLYEQQTQWEPAERAARDLIAAEPGEFQFRAILADAYIKQSRWNEAEETLRTALRDFPDSPQPTLLLAEFYGRRGDAAKAENELRAAIAANPKPIELHVALAGLLEKIRQPDQAARVYRDFIAKYETKPEAVQVRNLLAELLVRQGKSAESETLVDGVLTENPQDHQALLLKGKLALGRKNARDAIAALRSLLKDQPDSAEVLTLLAGAFQLDGKPVLVRETLEKAAHAKPADFRPRTNLVQFLIQQNNLPLALDQINDFLKAQPGHYEGLNLKADLLALSEQAESLEAVLKELKEKFPDKPAGAFRLAGFYQGQKKYEAALAEYEIALQKTPRDYEVLKAITALHLERKEPAKAEARLRKALAEDSNQPGAYQLLGSLSFSQGQGEEGVKALEKAIELAPKWGLPYVDLGAYYERRGDLDRAIAVTRKAVEAAPGDGSIYASLAALLEKARKPDQAEQVYRDFIAGNENKPEAARARNLLAEFLARTGRAGEGQLLVDEALTKNPHDSRALLLKAELALSEKKTQDAIPPLQTVLKDQPDSVEALTLLAEAYHLDGKPDLARESLEKAAHAKPADFGPRRSLVQFLVQQNKLAEALGEADDFLKSQPGHLDGLNLKADVLAAGKQGESLEALLKEIRERFPDSPMGPFRLGNFYQGRQKYEAALAEYDMALQKSQNAYEPLKALVSTYLEIKQPAKAEARLKKILAENPKHGGAYQLLGAVQFSEKREEQGIKSLTKAIELNPNWLPPYASLGAYYERQGQPERAIAVYRKALAAAPDDVGTLFNLARAYEASKQFDQAIAQYEAILKSNPNNLLAVNNLASLLSLSANDEANLKRALELAKRLETSGEPAFQDTLAWVYYLAGDAEKAQPIQNRVVEKAPYVPIFQYHLGMIYSKRGEAAKAKEHLAKSLESGTEFSDSADARKALQSLQ